MAGRNPIVMVVEDDFVDAELVRRGVQRRNLNYELYNCDNGEKALDLLRSDEFSAEQRESLIILLDINMPGMNGHQLLDEIRADKRLRRTIVFILTTSDHERDRLLAYDKNVAGYFLKSNLDGLLDTLAEYAEHVEFPPGG